MSSPREPAEPKSSGIILTQTQVLLATVFILAIVVSVEGLVYSNHRDVLSLSEILYILLGTLASVGGLIFLVKSVLRQLRYQHDQNVKMKKAAAALRRSEQKLKTYAEMSADWFWEQDTSFRFRVDSEIPDTSQSSDVGRARWELEGAVKNQENWDRHKADLLAHRPFRNFRWERIGTDGLCHYMNTSGDPIFDEQGVFQGYHGTGRDVTAEVLAAAELRRAKEETEAANKALRHLAYHDGLTGLANRILMSERLSKALQGARQSGSRVAVLALDLDRFKTVNDTLGHEAGDDLLVQVASRLMNSVRPTDTVARTGGDEIIIIQPGLAQISGATDLAQRLVDLLGKPFSVTGRQAIIGVSIGIAVYPSDGETGSVLLRAADTALYRAKKEGRNTFRLFNPSIDLQTRRNRVVEQGLREAIQGDRLYLDYQPIFATKSRAVVGFEALLRWQHPDLGNVSPPEIIAAAEESGQIVSLGAWILRQACFQAARWPGHLRVAVNLSGAQFREEGLAEQILTILQNSGLSPELLELEVTETLFIDNISSAYSTLHALKERGIRIALDDFGTGYSSLSYLRGFPFDKIKIDKSFVQALETDVSARTIFHAIVVMGHSLNLSITAEGIETEGQLQISQEEACDEIQGFLLGVPISSKEVAPFIELRSGQH